MGLLGDWGYTDSEGRKVSALQDMFDGGGKGRFGSTFEGGLLSQPLNNLGVRPYGYRRRLDEAMSRPAPHRPSQAAPSPAVDVVPTPQRGLLYSGRGDYGMPQPTPYDDAILRLARMDQPQYSGRGYVGMPMEPVYANDPLYSDTLAYLRSLGAANY